MKWFNKQSRIVQLILLLIPVVNYVVEIYVRVTALLHKQSTTNILGCICSFIPFFGWVDLIWVILFNKLALTE